MGIGTRPLATFQGAHRLGAATLPTHDGSWHLSGAAVAAVVGLLFMAIPFAGRAVGRSPVPGV